VCPPLPRKCSTDLHDDIPRAIGGGCSSHPFAWRRRAEGGDRGANRGALDRRSQLVDRRRRRLHRRIRPQGGGTARRRGAGAGQAAGGLKSGCASGSLSRRQANLLPNLAFSTCKPRHPVFRVPVIRLDYGCCARNFNRGRPSMPIHARFIGLLLTDAVLVLGAGAAQIAGSGPASAAPFDATKPEHWGIITRNTIGSPVGELRFGPYGSRPHRTNGEAALREGQPGDRGCRPLHLAGSAKREGGLRQRGRLLRRPGPRPGRGRVPRVPDGREHSSRRARK
jgi:hypothetical protein